MEQLPHDSIHGAGMFHSQFTANNCCLGIAGSRGADHLVTFQYFLDSTGSKELLEVGLTRGCSCFNRGRIVSHMGREMISHYLGLRY